MSKKTKKIIGIIIIILIIAILLLGVFRVQDIILKKIYRTDYAEFVIPNAETNGLDPYFVFAIIKAESNFKAGDTSSSGAIGLMQLLPETAIEEGKNIGEDIIVKQELYDPETNIKIGTSYYAKLKEKYQNELVALAAYNAGMGRVDEWLSQGIIKPDGSDIENIPYKETLNYVRKIERDYKIYQSLYE